MQEVFLPTKAMYVSPITPVYATNVSFNTKSSLQSPGRVKPNRLRAVAHRFEEAVNSFQGALGLEFDGTLGI